MSLTRRGTQTPIPHFLWGLALTLSLPRQHHKALPIDFSLTQAQSRKEADAKELWAACDGIRVLGVQLATCA